MLIDAHIPLPMEAIHVIRPKTLQLTEFIYSHTRVYCFPDETVSQLA